MTIHNVETSRSNIVRLFVLSIVMTILTISTVLLAIVWPSSAGPVTESEGTTEMRLTISGSDVSPSLRAHQLTCEPPGGDHPYRTAACRDLAIAGGDFSALPGEPERTCTGLYDPVTATALGQWQGFPLRFQRTYVNKCNLTAYTGPVFRFDG